MLSKLFPKKIKLLAGLDISSSCVKLLCLSRIGDSYQVDAFSGATLPNAVVVEKEIKNIDAVAEAVAEAVSKAGIKIKDAAVALASSSVINKIITMDAADVDNEIEVEEQVMLEADKHIPYPLEEVHLDFRVLGPSRGNKSKVDILLAASRAETVDNYVQALSRAGLTVRIVDVESFAIGKACFLLNKIAEKDSDKASNSEIIAVVDLGAKNTTISIYENHLPIFTRSELFGGDHLTKAIAKHYNLSFEEAEKAKLIDALPENYDEILTSFKEDILQHIRRGIEFYSSANHSENLNRIILAGGSSTIPNLKEFVSEKLAYATSIINPFANMRFHERVDCNSLQKIAPAMTLCCGLALRSFD